MKIWRSNICNIEEGKDCAHRVQGHLDQVLAAPHEGSTLIGFTQLSLNIISLAAADASTQYYSLPRPPILPQKVQFEPQFELVLVHTSQPELGTGTGPRTASRTRTELNRKYGSVLSVPVL